MPKLESEVFTISGSDMGQVVSDADGSRSVNRSTGVYERYVQPCLAEFFGSTLFIFVGCACVVANKGPGAIQPAVAHGLALAVVIVLFGQISGGHFNPAVTLCVHLCGGMSLPLVLPYILSQLLGGITGAGLVKVMFSAVEYQAGVGGAFTPDPMANDLGKITLAELVMTMFLTTTVTMGAVNKKTSSQLAPFCIGLTVTANILAGGGLSGACMNPARAFGPAVLANRWDYHWIYWVGPMCGALSTVIYVRLFLGDQKTRLILRK
ncbi:unnamed protein product [Knipowitschia caucasica]|uniref:Aquaporin 8a, tandem duplicate 1 n=1 Tax=Knipowitschia caucasica TaxID=637954 RepID=A0AAV2LFM2_KNICA